MKRSVMMLVVAAFFASGAPVNAEEGPFEKLGAACGEAAEKLCPDIELGQGRLIACLERNKDKVSEECNKARVDAEKQFEEQEAADPAAGPFEELGAVCGEEIEALCSKVTIRQGDILACLERNKDKISELCDRARVRAEKQFKEDRAAAD